MRIFARKAFKFLHPNLGEASIIVRAREFADVPDWVEGTLLFRLARQDEDITVMDSPKAVLEAEKTESADKGTSVQQKAAKPKAGE
jgi:hypothetical protein